MGCGCNRRKQKRQQSSRMPGTTNEPKVKKINGITVPKNMTPDQRRSTITKINNAKKIPPKKTREEIINERKCK